MGPYPYLTITKPVPGRTYPFREDGQRTSLVNRKATIQVAYMGSGQPMAFALSVN
jgi:hypothetical protein